MQLGVHSEIGKLRKVMVSRPSLAHERLTPGNCHDLLFDDVIWVQKARSDHADFVLKMKDRGVEVFDIQDLLTDIFRDSPEARAFVLDRRITDNQVGPALARILRPWLDELDPHLLAEPERAARRDQAAQLGRSREPAAQRGRGVAGEALEPVEHEQRRTTRQGPADPLDRDRGGADHHAQLEDVADRGQQIVDRLGLLEVADPRAILAARDLEREPGLAGAAGPEQRHQPLSAGPRVGDLAQLAPASDEGGTAANGARHARPRAEGGAARPRAYDRRVRGIHRRGSR